MSLQLEKKLSELTLEPSDSDIGIQVSLPDFSSSEKPCQRSSHVENEKAKDMDEIPPTCDPITGTSNTFGDNDISSRFARGMTLEQTRSTSNCGSGVNKPIFSGTRSRSGIFEPSSHKKYRASSRLSNGFRPRYFTESQDLSFLVEGNDHVGDVFKPAERAKEAMMDL
ncbi:uncharacterized protein L199_006122 [Kwoniella botswanensis]|uniref:uncharacterized protein n=1 Tax=Kwoniella botswanensis TaxID=1268659 RepID=UPI00315DC671